MQVISDCTIGSLIVSLPALSCTAIVIQKELNSQSNTSSKWLPRPPTDDGIKILISNDKDAKHCSIS